MCQVRFTATEHLYLVLVKKVKLDYNKPHSAPVSDKASFPELLCFIREEFLL